MATAVDPRKNIGPGYRPLSKKAVHRMADGGMIDPLNPGAVPLVASTPVAISAAPAVIPAAPIGGVGAALTPPMTGAAPAGDWASRKQLANVETGASSIVDSQSRTDAQTQLAALTPKPAAVPGLTSPPMATGAIGLKPSGIARTQPPTSAVPALNPMGMRDGGAAYVNGSRSGGRVVGRGDGTVDTVPAKYADGEYVLPTDTAQAIGYDKLDAIKNATHTPVAQQKAKGSSARMVNGGVLTDEDRKQLVQQIPTTGYPAAPPDDGRSNTELSRNVQNAGNALGGMGVVASVPLRSAQIAMSAAPVLPNAMPRLGTSAANATNFVAGMGSGAQVAAAPVSAVAQAIPRLPAVNAALQEGAQANALAGVTRGFSNAGALLAGSEQAQGATPIAPASTTRSAPSEYGRQMGEVGNLLANGAAAVAKTIVSAPGYGFNQAATSAPSASPVAPAPPLQASTAGNGRGTAPRPDLLGNPGSIEQQVKDMGAVDAKQTMSALPVNATVDTPQNTPDGRRVMAMNNQLADSMRADRLAAEAGAQTFTQAPGTDWQSRKDLQNAQTGASSIIENEAQKSAAAQVAGINARNAQASLQQQLGTAEMARLKVTDTTNRRGQDAQNAMANAQNTLATAKFGLDQRTSDRAGTGIDLDNKVKQRLADVQSVLLDPKATDAQRENARENARSLSGKDKELPNRFTVVPGGQEIDPASGLPVRSPATVINNQTGEFVNQVQSKPAFTPNAGAISMLKSNPKMAADFDAKYGQGAAARALGQK